MTLDDLLGHTSFYKKKSVFKIMKFLKSFKKFDVKQKYNYITEKKPF